LHGLLVSQTAKWESFNEQLMLHITDGSCICGDRCMKDVTWYCHDDAQPVHDVLELKIRLLEALGPKLKSLPLHCLLQNPDSRREI
jgi:hypothetical protein